MLAPPRNARLLHTIVVMGVALTGGTLGAGCGGATQESPAALDAGGTKDGDSTDAYPTIGIADAGEDTGYAIIYPAPPREAGTDAYPTIGFYEPDGGLDAYGTIKSAVDAAVDAYPTIEPAIDAGTDAYAIISPPPPGGH